MLRWSEHAEERALERFAIRGGYLRVVSDRITQAIAEGNFEEFWEYDRRLSPVSGKERGERLNTVVLFEFNGERLYAVVRDGWICTLLYESQYRHNKLCGMWTLFRENASPDSGDGMSFRPFAKLRKDK